MLKEQIEYLYAGISDTQSLINFIDTKTAGAITIIGLFIATVFAKLDELIQYNEWFSLCHWIFLVLTGICVLLSVIVVARILKPTVNPEFNIEKQHVPGLKFFLAKNNYDHGKIGRFIYPFINSQQFKLEGSLENYSGTVSQADEDGISKSLAFELLKLSYIRNIKNDRFHYLFNLLVITTGFFITFIVLHTKEMLTIKALVACGCIPGLN